MTLSRSSLNNSQKGLSKVQRENLAAQNIPVPPDTAPTLIDTPDLQPTFIGDEDLSDPPAPQGATSPPATPFSTPPTSGGFSMVSIASLIICFFTGLLVWHHLKYAE